MKMIKRFKASFNQYRKYFKIDTHFGFEDARKNYFDITERKTYEIRIMKCENYEMRCIPFLD